MTVRKQIKSLREQADKTKDGETSRLLREAADTIQKLYYDQVNKPKPLSEICMMSWAYFDRIRCTFGTYEHLLPMAKQMASIFTEEECQVNRITGMPNVYVEIAEGRNTDDPKVYWASYPLFKPGTHKSDIKLDPEVRTYKLQGYDKDHDIHTTYDISTHLGELVNELRDMLPKLKNDMLLHPDTGEPVDWLEITDEADPDMIYFASYDLIEYPTHRKDL